MWEKPYKFKCRNYEKYCSPPTTIPLSIKQPDWAKETFEGHILDGELGEDGWNLLLKDNLTGMYFLAYSIDFE